MPYTANLPTHLPSVVPWKRRVRRHYPLEGRGLTVETNHLGTGYTHRLGIRRRSKAHHRPSSADVGRADAERQQAAAEAAAVQAQKDYVERQSHAFTATATDGKPISLDMYRGKAVLVDFWGSWVNWYKEDIANLVKVYGDYHDKGL